MGRMSPEVMQHPLDTAWQNVFTYASWGIVLIMVVIAVRKAKTERTPFYLMAIVAAGVGAFAEPLYDVAFDLWFYDAKADGTPGAAQAHFTAFDIVQPNWTHSGYIILYAMACLYAGKRIYDGRMTRVNLFQIWLLEIAASCVFEVIGTGVNVYTYYGPYELRIGNYPLVIGVLEGTQVMLFTVLAVQIWRRVKTGWGTAALIPAFPITMLGGNFGLGWPIIIALHLDEPSFSSTIVWIGTFVSIGLCALAVRGASLFLPEPPEDEAPAPVAPPPVRERVPA
ncbi:hypothetical protein DSM112329_02774 [Paraconexibacter sp. AEG42_29]|uniref:Uncharacterized protein n=1 Tax=Paraconexibacter sp. AEG42_29 TaxID=2997339 RepID=A0AAU7AW43_9ACTN